MKMKTVIITWILGGIFFWNTSIAQKTTIRIVDSQTESVISYANVVLYTMKDVYLKGGVTNDKGEISFEIESQVKVKASYVGYTNYSGICKPGENLTIKMATDFASVDEVVITGQNVPKPADKSIYKIDYIDNKKLELRGVSNLADALSNETNIRLKVDPALGTSLELQGMGGENVKFLVDGVPIIGRLNGEIDLTQINLDNVDHIEVVQGPMSVVYGTNALAGVVNIITKKNTSIKNFMNLDTYAGSEGSYNTSINASILRKEHSFTLSGVRNMFQGVDLIDSSRSQEFKPKLQYITGFVYAYAKNDFRLQYKTDYFHEEIRHYGNIQGISANDSYFITQRLVNSLQGNKKLGENLNLDVLAAFSGYTRETDNYRVDLTNFEKLKVGTNATTSFLNLMGRANFAYNKKDSKFTYLWGLDMNYDNAKGDKIASKDPSMGDYAVYTTAQYQFLPTASLQPGLRLIYNTKYGAPLTPSINLQWQLFNDFNIRVSYSQGFRAPSIKELYLNFVDSNHDLHGNENLKAETSNSYNLSCSYKLEKKSWLLKFEPSFFFNDGKNIIALELVPGPGTPLYRNFNLGRRRTTGGDANLNVKLYSGLSLSAGFSRVGIAIAEDVNSTKLSDYIFYNNYSATAGYNFRRIKFNLNSSLKYYSSTPDYVRNANGDIVVVKKNGYGDLELTASKQLFNNRITLTAGGKNLLNNIYIGYSNGSLSSSPISFGRYFFLKLNIKLQKL